MIEGLAQIQPAQLETIGRSVLEDFLRLPVQQADTQPAESNGCGALVTISGSWEGVVELRVSGRLGSRIAAAMFHCSQDAVDDDKLRDALDEVANIVGGNVKALLPAPSRLSMPEFRPAGTRLPEVDAGVHLMDEYGDSLWIGVTSLGTG